MFCKRCKILNPKFEKHYRKCVAEGLVLQGVQEKAEGLKERSLININQIQHYFQTLFKNII